MFRSLQWLRLSRGWIFWIITILFLLYEFALRFFPNSIPQELLSAFSISDKNLLYFTLWYFAAYILMQIPAGILLDHFGVNKVLFFASFICGLGSFLFGSTSFFLIAQLGRFLMGLGASFAFLGMIYSCSIIEHHKLSLCIGLGYSISILGAFGIEQFNIYLTESFNFHFPSYGMAIIGLLLGSGLYFCSQPYKEEILTTKKTFLTREKISTICKNPQSWINATTAMLFYITPATYASFWGIPYLYLKRDIPYEFALLCISTIFIGWAIGAPIVGYYSDRVQKRLLFVQISTILSTILIIAIIYLPIFSNVVIWILHLLLGIFSSTQLLHFSIAMEINKFLAPGISLALTNTVVSVGLIALQPVIGILLKQHSKILLENLDSYSISDFQFAFILFPLTLFGAFVLSFCIKEKCIDQRMDQKEKMTAAA
ncbi:MAG: MFS transporter [Chlamydiales bacterium]